ncbi:MAG: hypothetical protein PUD24_06165 [Oscillospiraceae bacterium]|nr:hypothetical protein [Oscillospiraceae bacterium]
MKKALSIITCLLVIFMLFILPASAANNTDTNFSISITSTSVTSSNSATARRLKTDTSSSYINYTKLADKTTSASGPYKFIAKIYGSATSSSAMVDCTSYVHNSSGTVIGYRSDAVVTKGSVGLIRQDVYEMFGSGAYGQIWGRAYSSSYTGTAKGCWSVDSVGSYSYYNASTLY